MRHGVVGNPPAAPLFCPDGAGCLAEQTNHSGKSYPADPLFF
jgi:hypothetical protein